MAEAFTYDGYIELLRDYLAAGYAFESFPGVVSAAPGGRPALLMRHDIDFDLAAARRMAEIEADAGARATYFFLLRTAHYNLFSAEGTAETRRILDAGHHLGLHFDCAAYPPEAAVNELARFCAKEASILGDWFERPVEVVSYHRPNAAVLTGDAALSAPLPHTYMPRFTREMKYCSDSRGEWRYGDPRSTPEFARRAPMQILIHPLWWNPSVSRAPETLDRWLSGRVESLAESMAANCTVYRKGAEA